MAKAITDLTLKLGKANEKLAEAQSSIATLTSKLAKTGTRPNGPTAIPKTDMTLMGKYGYCWSHGFKMKQGHNSSAFRFQREGHMPEATRNNIMGGKMWNKGWYK